MHLRKSKQREGKDSMTGQMKDVLLHLREMLEQDQVFVELRYPFAHGTVIKSLLKRDWIFEGVKRKQYGITLRGLKALETYEHEINRRDGICPRCCSRLRHINGEGRRLAYCLPCERKRNRDRRLRGAMTGNPDRPCSRCKKRPRHQFPGGVLSSYCSHCETVKRRMRARKEGRRLLKSIRAGASVPMCQICKERPRRVFENCVSKYCAECAPVYFAKLKFKRVLERRLG
jgi:hypothetical protein